MKEDVGGGRFSQEKAKTSYYSGVGITKKAVTSALHKSDESPNYRVPGASPWQGGIPDVFLWLWRGYQEAERKAPAEVMNLLESLAEGTRFENLEALETIGPDLTSSFRSQ